MAKKVKAKKVVVLKRRIFVFGSNREGRHGLGAALHALDQWGAVLGQDEGLQGDAYGIITKELRRWKPPVTVEEVQEGVDRFLAFAGQHPEMEFILSPIGCGLAGFCIEDIAPMFEDRPGNILLPKEFAEYLYGR